MTMNSPEPSPRSGIVAWIWDPWPTEVGRDRVDFPACRGPFRTCRWRSVPYQREWATSLL